MASEGADDGAGSLFEGMVLFTASSTSSDLPVAEVDASPPPSSPRDATPTPAPAPAPAPQPQPPSQALDEDLFSDLTLQAPPSPHPILLDPSPTLPPPSSPLQPPLLSSRQPSRRKKRAVRIGYAREPLASLEEPPVPSDPYANDLPSPSSTSPTIGATTASNLQVADEPPPTSSRDVDVGPDPRPDTAVHVEDDDLLPPSPSPRSQGQEADKGNPDEVVVNDDEGQRPPEEQDDGKEEETPSSGQSSTKEDALGSAEERLYLIRARISEKLESIRQRAASAYAERKELQRRRRQAVDSVNSASGKHKDLERELELACEAEDFERAESVSEDIAAVEEEKVKLLQSLKDAEADCECAESKMQEVLELQIAAEEEGIALLEQFAEDAADNAQSILKKSEEIFHKEQQEWQSSVELLEIKKLEMVIESQLISEAHSGLENAIENLVKSDLEEKESLTRKHVVLSNELDELLQLVRLKEAEIAENKFQIENVEKRISDAVSVFNEARSSIDIKHENLESDLIKVESENEALLAKQKAISEVFSSAEEKRKKMMELSSISSDEAKSCRSAIGLKKKLASFFLKSREDRVNFSKTEENILEDIQLLRQQISASRNALQELSSTRASTQQEVSLYKQRMGFIEKRCPELEAEKKVAAAARNFKEAGRVAAEAKALQSEKEELQEKLEKAIVHLEKLEKGIKDNLDSLQENEELISIKEKEAALAGCNRLLLVAAAARAERLAALKMGDVEEGSILLKEAEAAESKAMELQKEYSLDVVFDAKQVVSLAFITNLNGDNLAEVASFDLPSVA